jgi:hypothetical protein
MPHLVGSPYDKVSLFAPNGPVDLFQMASNVLFIEHTNLKVGSWLAGTKVPPINHPPVLGRLNVTSACPLFFYKFEQGKQWREFPRVREKSP